MSSLKRKILEIGCGYLPLPYWRLYCLAQPEKSVPVRTPLMDEYANLLSKDEFFFLDINEKILRNGYPKVLDEVVKKFPEVKEIKTYSIVGDGKELPFGNELFDAIILSNVLSAPEPGTTPMYESYSDNVCISSPSKRRIIMDGLRVLKRGGVMIIAITLTPCYALKEMEWIENSLVKKEKIRLFKECGEFVGASDNWHLYHAAFQKEGGIPIENTEKIPWTSRQEQYINQYAASWMIY